MVCLYVKNCTDQALDFANKVLSAAPSRQQYYWLFVGFPGLNCLKDAREFWLRIGKGNYMKFCIHRSKEVLY